MSKPTSAVEGRTISRRHKEGILCHECGSQFTTMMGLQRHVKSKHEHSYSFSCRICSKNFVEKHHLEGHLLHHHATDIAKHKCSSCDKTYAYKSSLERHKNICKNTMSNECSFVCHTCSAVFSRHDLLKSHMKGVHNNIFKYHCELCGENYKWRSSLSAHKRAKHT